MPRNGPASTSPPSSVPPQSLLAIETSCDETAAAVCSLEGHLLSNLVASQHEVHGRFGGVVPELASHVVSSVMSSQLTLLTRSLQLC